MSSSTLPVPQVNLGNTFGALFISAILAAVLVHYSLTMPSKPSTDRYLSDVTTVISDTHRGTGVTFYRLAVVWLWILDALHLALIVDFVYYYLVTNYANFSALTGLVWSFKFQSILDATLVFSVHLLYVHRIWMLSKGRSLLLPGIALTVIVLLFGGVVIPFIVASYKCNTFSDLIAIAWWTYATVGTSTFIDIVIASSLCYLLATSRTGFSRTDSFLTKLMGYTISTGCLTSICSIIVLITCATLSGTFIFLAIYFLVAKLYVNSFFALLNERYYVQGNADTVISSGSHGRHSVHRPGLHIRVSQDTEIQTSRTDEFKHLDDGVLHVSQPVMSQAPTAGSPGTMEMKSFSLA
ncbi:uncharacterized protein EDB91DRAFT_641337 [Suillus paluster]|uniref:uncharacterized protein n=1 Tax=Suillus paluster TaxID=48578 RepID=UPI001B85DD66|nr:uncharacterized protein EDB91DRAFT_641337 [Suillus paluster]KAG1733365.1 hypothetical protein EDB91DRAFT_641337 [Suillus paluster]